MYYLTNLYKNNSQSQKRDEINLMCFETLLVLLQKNNSIE